jgi:hypothetical protein
MPPKTVEEQPAGSLLSRPPEDRAGELEKRIRQGMRVHPVRRLAIDRGSEPSNVDLTVRQHFEKLEEHLVTLSTQVVEENALLKRNELEAEIRSLKLALEHFRAALEIESGVLRRSQ